MNITKSLGLDKLIARRAEINAAAQREAETATVNAVNEAMLAYAETQTSATEKTLESAYEKLCALAFAKAVAGGDDTYPLDEVLADGHTVREACADAIGVIDRVRKIRNDIALVKSSIESEEQRAELMRQKYIVDIENAVAKDRAFLADAEAKLAAAEKELDALKVRYGVK